jgi:hypothetical protein
LEYLKERENSRNIGVDGRTILKYILKKWVLLCGLDPLGAGKYPVEGCCEHGNEHSVSIKDVKFSYYLSDY